MQLIEKFYSPDKTATISSSHSVKKAPYCCSASLVDWCLRILGKNFYASISTIINMIVTKVRKYIKKKGKPWESVYVDMSCWLEREMEQTADVLSCTLNNILFIADPPLYSEHILVMWACIAKLAFLFGISTGCFSLVFTLANPLSS